MPEETVVAVDYGGTRTKLARFDISGQITDLTVMPSEPNPEQMLEQIKSFIGTDRWGIALQGEVSLDQVNGSWQFGAKPRPKERQIRFAEFRKMISAHGIGLPDLLINDVSAAALAVGKNGWVAQLSTGSAIRPVISGLLVVDHQAPLLTGLSSTIYQSRSFYRWLRRERLMEWIDPKLRGLSWRELGESGAPELEKIAEVFVTFIELARQRAPIDDGQIYLVGGGAFALRAQIEAELSSRGLVGNFPDDSERPGLRGVYRCLAAGHIPMILRSASPLAPS